MAQPDPIIIIIIILVNWIPAIVAIKWVISKMNNHKKDRGQTNQDYDELVKKALKLGEVLEKLEKKAEYLKSLAKKKIVSEPPCQEKKDKTRKSA